MNSRKLVLVDGMAVLYRCFYAIRGLSTKTGQTTNALFGFIRMLKQVREMWGPTHWAVAFDGGLPKSRLDLIKTYKAQRPPMPGDLKSQIPLAEEYLNRSGITWFRIEGQEADDIIATLAEQARSGCKDVYIATSDKDIFQLVDEKIKIVPVMGKEGVLDVAGVKLKTGVMPSQIIDWLAMVGDSSDNIPGVPGVGAKTAARLLDQFGTIDDLLDRTEEVSSERIRLALEQNRDLIATNRAMIRLKKDLACPLVWDSLEVRLPSPGKLIPFLEEMEFHSMTKELREQELFVL